MGTRRAKTRRLRLSRAEQLIAAGLIALATPAAAPAQEPIPENPGAEGIPRFIGEPAKARPLRSLDPPRHPYMAPNGASNLHVDAFQTDVHQVMGPLGNNIQRSSTFFAADCASVTFDRRDRIVTICVGLNRPTMRLLDPVTLETLASYELPGRQPTAGASPFNDFAGGGYFYLDHRDRAIVPTTTRHLLVISQTDEPAFKVDADLDLSPYLADDDKVFAVMPDWRGHIWFASQRGVMGTADPATGKVFTIDLGEAIANSFAVDDTGGVFVVTDKALVRLDASRKGKPKLTWREVYDNSGIAKPGQVNAGSGTTPSLMGRDLVAITDNDDPMKVVFYKRGRRVKGERKVCSQPVFQKGSSATDNSLITTPRSAVVENNYGYTGPASVEAGRSTTPGLARVDVDRRRRKCSVRWESSETSPTVVPKLSARNGLVYAYTKTPNMRNEDSWYLTAIDFRNGKTIYKALAGEGVGFNNNYAPVTLAADGTAYVGVLGGLVRLADAEPPPGAEKLGRVRPRPARLRAKRLSPGWVRARVTGTNVKRVDFLGGTRKLATDRTRPFAKTVRPGKRRLRARVTFTDGLRRILTWKR